MGTELDQKYSNLQENIRGLKRVVVAFSGGVDSTLLLKVAIEVLGQSRVLAVTAASSIRLKQKSKKASRLAEKIGAPHLIINPGEINNKEFARNDARRCYYCKKILFNKLQEIAGDRGYNYVIDGTNKDDAGKQDRPGLKALREYEIKSPLWEADLSKKEIRKLSQTLDLSTWNQASDTCLATRFSHDLQIEGELLEKLRGVELHLADYGFTQVRARLDDKDSLRIEVLPEEMEIIMNHRPQIVEKAKGAGFKYISLDLQGYRSGSMNRSQSSLTQS